MDRAFYANSVVDFYNVTNLAIYKNK